MTITKKQIQQRVLKNGSPIPLDSFSWDETTRTFSSNIKGLVIDFGDFDDCTINAVWGCTINAGSGCTINAGSNCTINAVWSCTIHAGSYSTINTGSHSTINTGSYCTIKAGSGCTIDLGNDCTIKAEGERIAIVNRNVFEVIQPSKGDIIQICPSDIPGHLVNGKINGEPHIIADGILSKIIKQRGDVYRVINYGQSEQSYLIKQGDVFAHGKTLAEARESLIYKFTERDTSAYDGLTPESEMTFAEAVTMYRTITGACAEGCQYFVEQNQDKRKDKYTVAEIIALTQGQYEHHKLTAFFERKEA